MDSVTQIILGAAVGEAVAGKKLGNRAMMWGAIGGTIPDFDVLANFFMSEIDALAFHRGIMHSFLFAILAPFALAKVTQSLYDSGLYQNKYYKAFVMSLNILFFCLMAGGIIFVSKSPLVAAVLGLGGVLLGILLWKKYFTTHLSDASASFKTWYWLWFAAIFTHPILDCFTAYGTQVFQPFSNYAVAFNNIAVVDPLYSIPFLICLLIALSLARNTPRRAMFNWLGIGISSAYMLYTIYNKVQVDGIMKKSLQEQNIDYQRFTTSPTIFNNFLWHGVAEGDTAYYQGYYSIFDKKPSFNVLRVIPKQHGLLKQYENDKGVGILQRFSKGYYNVTEKVGGVLQFNDLRYGSMEIFTGQKDQYVFRFLLENKQDGLHISTDRDDPREANNLVFQSFWNRIMGRTGE